MPVCLGKEVDLQPGKMKLDLNQFPSFPSLKGNDLLLQRSYAYAP